MPELSDTQRDKRLKIPSTKHKFYGETAELQDEMNCFLLT